MRRRLAPNRILIPVVTCLAAALIRPPVAFAQCAMCGAAAASSTGVARGIALSIFFLLGTLVLLVGWLVVLVLRAQIRPREVGGHPAPAESAASIAPSPLPSGHAPKKN